MGESMEPVIFAMVRDGFSDPSERFTMIAALQMMAFVGREMGGSWGDGEVEKVEIGDAEVNFISALTWL